MNIISQRPSSISSNLRPGPCGPMQQTRFCQQYHTSNHATVWRWREAFQNDFAARMDWCIKSYEEANHPPVPSLAHEAVLEVREGEQVVLKAEGCQDPDGDELDYRWMYYREAGNSVYWLNMKQENSPKASFTAPSMGFPQEMHFILAVSDRGQPNLTRYKRVLVKVQPKPDGQDP
jgi:hypothetical protein